MRHMQDVDSHYRHEMQYTVLKRLYERVTSRCNDCDTSNDGVVDSAVLADMRQVIQIVM